MSTRSSRLTLAITAALLPGLAWAQHEAHQAVGAEAPGAELTACVRVQPVIQNIIAAATARAEAARLSNSPSELRAAVDHLQGAMRDIRVQLAPCAAVGSSDPHAGHAMADVPAKRTSPLSKPPAAKPAQQTGSHPHPGHSAPHPGDKKGHTKMDPVNGLIVDPVTAPTTIYQGQTYYFSSEQSKKEFLANPEKFAEKVTK